MNLVTPSVFEFRPGQNLLVSLTLNFCCVPVKVIDKRDNLFSRRRVLVFTQGNMLKSARAHCFSLHTFNLKLTMDFHFYKINLFF